MAERKLTPEEIALCRACDEWAAANPRLADRLFRLRMRLPDSRLDTGRGRWFWTGLAAGCFPATLAVFSGLPWKFAVMVPGWVGALAGTLAFGAWMLSEGGLNRKAAEFHRFAISEAARADALAEEWTKEDVERIDALAKLEAGLCRPERPVSVEMRHLLELAGFLKLRR